MISLSFVSMVSLSHRLKDRKIEFALDHMRNLTIEKQSPTVNSDDTETKG